MLAKHLRMYQNESDSTPGLETLREENRRLSRRLAETESELIKANKKTDEILQNHAPDSVSKDELVRSKTELIGKIEQKLNARNVKLKKFDGKVKYLLEELSTKDKIISKLKTQLMLEEEQSAQSEEKFQNLKEKHDELQKEVESGVSQQDFDELKEEMQAKEADWTGQRNVLVMQKESLQQTLNEQAMQSQRISMQLSEMTHDIRNGMREREALTTEKQHLTRELAILKSRLARESEQNRKLGYDLRKSHDDIKEYHKFLKRSARELESSISDLKLLQSKTSECRVDMMARNHFFLKVLKFLKSRTKRLPSENSGYQSRKRQYRKSSAGARSDIRDVRIGSPPPSISMIVKDAIRSEDFEEIGGSPLPSHSPLHHERSKSTTVNFRKGLAAAVSSGRSVSPGRARSPSLHSNLSELSLTEMNWSAAEKRAMSMTNLTFPIPPVDMSSTNRYYEVRLDGLRLYSEPNRESEVLSFLRRGQCIFVVEEVEGFYRISEPRLGKRSGWILKTQQNGELLVEPIYEEYRVSGDSQTLFASIGGAEIRSMIQEMLVLTCERLGDWIRVFYPSKGWMKILDSEGKPVLERKRFLSDDEAFHDYTHPGFKLVKFSHRQMLQYGMILKPRVQNSESVVVVSETIAPFLRSEVPIGSVLQAIGHVSVANMRYLECMKTIETCSLPVILVLRIPELNSPHTFSGRRLSTQSLPWGAQIGHRTPGATPRSQTTRNAYSRFGGASPNSMSVSNGFPPVPTSKANSVKLEPALPMNFNFQRNEISVFLMNYGKENEKEKYYQQRERARSQQFRA